MRITTIIMGLLLSNNAPVESRIKIAVIDTGIDSSFVELKPYFCKTGHKSIVDNTPMTDSTKMKHGTNVTGLIAKSIDPNKACLIIIKFYSSEKSNTVAAINHAISQQADFINMSLGGSEYSTTEYRAITKALSLGIKIAVAAGNDYRNLDNNCYYYPACYAKTIHSNQFKVVGSNTYSDKHYTNYGSIVSTTENGTNVGLPRLTGTSQATAIFTGKWVNNNLK